MNHWITGAATGDWSRLIGMLDPAVTFHVPVEGFAGVRHGAEDAVRFFDWLAASVRADLVVQAVLAGESGVAFEVRVAGTMRGEPFAQRLCLIFELHDGRVTGFREYLAWPGGLR
ncbi:nuclear transport factor 2 family protein [Dactylosporangium maewongense]